jgi:hypothetical protein
MTTLSDFSASIPMPEIVEMLKFVSGSIAVLAPVIKLFFGKRPDRGRELEERSARIKAFYEEGGLDLQPLRMESAFAAAMGHSRLDAREIPLLLRQKKPTSFITTVRLNGPRRVIDQALARAAGRFCLVPI